MKQAAAQFEQEHARQAAAAEAAARGQQWRA
jgi:hypothetical protein